MEQSPSQAAAASVSNPLSRFCETPYAFQENAQVDSRKIRHIHTVNPCALFIQSLQLFTPKSPFKNSNESVFQPIASNVGLGSIVTVYGSENLDVHQFLSEFNFSLSQDSAVLVTPLPLREPRCFHNVSQCRSPDILYSLQLGNHNDYLLGLLTFLKGVVEDNDTEFFLTLSRMVF